MNYKLLAIILVLLAGIYKTVLDLVRSRSANNPTPDNLADVYDAETYARWKEYGKDHSRLSIISDLLALGITLALLLSNAHSLFASIFPASAFMQLSAVLILEIAVSTVLEVIFSYIRTMKIEEKYGFNRSTIKTFIKDKIRGLIVEVILSLGITTLLWGLYENLGDWIVLLFAVIVFLVSMVIIFLYPILSRIGNTFTPLADGELKDSLLALLTKHGILSR